MIYTFCYEVKFTFIVENDPNTIDSLGATAGFYLIKWDFINIELINCHVNDDVGKVEHFAYLQSIYGRRTI